MASWDASREMDEHHIVANLIQAAISIYSDRQHQRHDLRLPPDPCVILRRHNTFLGRINYSHARRGSLLLHIQIPVQKVWLRHEELDPADEGPDYPTHFRMLYLKIRNEKPLGAEALIVPPPWIVCNESVAGLCDVHMEALGMLFQRIGAWTVHSVTFVGTQAQFQSCLAEVKEEIWANEKGQLDAWQQLCMLACVKKDFRDFWTVVTPETQELARITL